MKAILKKIHSPDIHDLKAYSPKNPESFSFLLQAFIGPKGCDGEESFDFIVCTPHWIKERLAVEKVILGDNKIIVREYDIESIILKIEQLIVNFEGETWEELAKKIDCYAVWEFRDYEE